MALSRRSALTEVARDPTARANLVAFGLVLITASLVVGAIALTLGLTPAQNASLTFVARTLRAVGGLFLGLAFLVPAVSDDSLGTALRIAYLSAGVVVLAGIVILRFVL